MKCPQCNTNELVGKQKYCSGACKTAASRDKSRPALDASRTRPEGTPTGIPKGTRTEAPEQKEVQKYSHATLTTENDPKAVRREVGEGPSKRYEYVIPGRHMIGSGENAIETSCLNPKCSTAL